MEVEKIVQQTTKWNSREKAFQAPTPMDYNKCIFQIMSIQQEKKKHEIFLGNNDDKDDKLFLCYFWNWQS